MTTSSLAQHGIDCICCPRDDGSDADSWDHWDLKCDDAYLSPLDLDLPLIEVEELHPEFLALPDSKHNAHVFAWIACEVFPFLAPPGCLVSEQVRNITIDRYDDVSELLDAVFGPEWPSAPFPVVG